MKKSSSVIAVILAVMVLVGTVAHIWSNGTNISNNNATYQVEVDRPWVG